MKYWTCELESCWPERMIWCRSAAGAEGKGVGDVDAQLRNE